ncbi:MAG: UDP-2,3-diacylglucosamine diphosphatase LpxI [Hydrogenothermaceae bacterium]
MKVGLIAGSGQLPLEFAKSVSETENQLYIFAIKSSTDKNIEKFGKTFWFSFGEAQKLIDTMKSLNVENLVMLGKIEHSSILFHFYKLDSRSREFLSKIKDRRAKSILYGIIEELEEEGFNFIDPTPYLRNLLVPEGVLTQIEPDDNLMEDIKFGMRIAKEIADLDIGQTVVVKDKVVVAVEGIEGTDRCILRSKDLVSEGVVVCKAARKNQDMRYDVPVIGMKTLENIKKVKGKALAVEAGKTYLLDRDVFLKKADQWGIPVVGVKLE